MFFGKLKKLNAVKNNIKRISSFYPDNFFKTFNRIIFDGTITRRELGVIFLFLQVTFFAKKMVITAYTSKDGFWFCFSLRFC